MADNYLEKKYEEYEKRKAAFLLKSKYKLQKNKHISKDDNK